MSFLTLVSRGLMAIGMLFLILGLLAVTEKHAYGDDPGSGNLGLCGANSCSLTCLGAFPQCGTGSCLNAPCTAPCDCYLEIPLSNQKCTCK